MKKSQTDMILQFVQNGMADFIYLLLQRVNRFVNFHVLFKIYQKPIKRSKNVIQSIKTYRAYSLKTQDQFGNPPLRFVWTTLSFFYKQLALGWQIAKQILGFNLLSLCHSENYRLKKVEFSLSNKRKIAVKLSMHQNSAVSKFTKIQHFWELFKSLITNIGFES